MPDIRERTLWIKSKVSEGLLAAGVTPVKRKWVEDTFLSLPGPTQKGLIDAVGGFGLFASDANKEKRDLCRAMNVALAFHDLLNGRKFVYDSGWREKILTRLDLPAARQAVLAQVDAAFAAGKPVEAFEPINLPGPEAVVHEAVPAPILPHAHPVSASVDKAGAGWRKLKLAIAPVVKTNLNVKHAGQAFKAEGAARHERMDAYVASQSGDIGMVWTAAGLKVREAINDVTTTNLENLVSFNSVIGTAYASFERNVKENQELLKDNVAIVGKLFTALKSAPPPLSLIGAIGEAAAGAITVHEKIDVGSRFESLKGPRASGFFVKLTTGLDDLRDKHLRVGPDLATMGSLASLQSTLQRLCRERNQEMKDVLRAICDEHFGTSSDVLKRFYSVVEKAVADGGGAVRGRIGELGEQHALDAKGNQVTAVHAARDATKQMVCDRIVAYQEELLQEMRPAIELPKRFVPEDAGYAIEMMLYSTYIVALFSNKQFRIKPVGEGIVNFFARAEPWGVLMLDTDHNTATEKQRLKWDNDPNHKMMLMMFCDWYVKNVNPFMLITGARRNGVLYTPKLIEVMCKTHIDKINAAVKVGRSTVLGLSKWDKKAIEVEYARLCA